MEYIASFSGGKDSTASIILAHENNEPLDLIIFCEVMFDEDTSGELPEHIDFIKNQAFPLFHSWGYKTQIIHGPTNYMEIFNHRIERTKKEERKGMKAGFPMSMRCALNRSCKVRPIQKFYKERNMDEIIQYIGIAIDEPKRLERLKDGNNNKVSLLAKYGYTEEMALSLCKKYNLLSPIYEFAPRGGCWFCPNASYAELRHLKKFHPDLWNKLRNLENQKDTVGKIYNTLKQVSLKDLEEKIYWEDAQLTVFDFLEE